MGMVHNMKLEQGNKSNTVVETTISPFIAHEIRNALTISKGFLQLASSKNNLCKHEKYIHMALEEINRAAEILNDSLITKQENTDEKCSVNEFLLGIIQLFTYQVQHYPLNISTNFSEESLYIPNPENELKGVFINLINNAIEATELEKERTIEITTKRKQNTVLISIKDNGCGMDDRLLNKIFSPFFTTKKKGTGIGLTICKQIINESNGRIYATSKINKGTIFYVELPLAPS